MNFQVTQGRYITLLLTPVVNVTRYRYGSCRSLLPQCYSRNLKIVLLVPIIRIFSLGGRVGLRQMIIIVSQSSKPNELVS